MRNVIITNKNIGETPLECLERIRLDNKIDENIPMTYAGRLDPMAEGQMIILVGDECKNKEKYLNLDKEYEVEVLFGISTDTHDILGLIEGTGKRENINIDINKYIGDFLQEYPKYSSKTVNGKQMHEYAREGNMPSEIPKKNVRIYSIENMGYNEIISNDLLNRILNNISKVHGDFRQEEITALWRSSISRDFSNYPFKILKLRIRCSSGTYMRSLAFRMGNDIGIPALALSIKRLFLFTNE